MKQGDSNCEKISILILVLLVLVLRLVRFSEYVYVKYLNTQILYNTPKPRCYSTTLYTMYIFRF